MRTIRSTSSWLQHVAAVVGAAGLVGGLVGAGVAAPPAFAALGGGTVAVTAGDLVTGTPASGQFQVQDNGDGSGGVSVVAGPGVSPNGIGSLQLSTTGSGSHWSVFNYGLYDYPIGAISHLAYTTYSDSSTYAPALQIEINPGSASTAGVDAGCPTSATFSTLNLEPYLQPGGITPKTWQYWGIFASTAVIWGTHISNTTCLPEGYDGNNWQTVRSYYPNAKIIAIGVNVGSGWPASTGNVANLQVGIGADGATDYTTYDFVPAVSPTVSGSSSSGSTATLGQSVADTATVTGNTVEGPPAGQVQFSVCYKTTSSCSNSSPLGTEPLSPAGDHASTATSAPFTPIAAGTWCFIASYVPSDLNRYTASDPAETCVTVGYSSPCITTATHGRTTVGAGEALCVGPGGELNGPVDVEPGGALDVEGGAIHGPLSARGATLIRLCGANLHGPVTVRDATGPAVIGWPHATPACAGNTIHGPMSLSDNSGGLQVHANTVYGPVTASGNSGTVGISDNTVHGPPPPS